MTVGTAFSILLSKIPVIRNKKRTSSVRLEITLDADRFLDYVNLSLIKLLVFIIGEGRDFVKYYFILKFYIDFVFIIENSSIIYP